MVQEKHLRPLKRLVDARRQLVAAAEAPAMQADPADLIRTQLWKSWSASLVFFFFLMIGVQ